MQIVPQLIAYLEFRSPHHEMGGNANFKDHHEIVHNFLTYSMQNHCLPDFNDNNFEIRDVSTIYLLY